MHAEQMGVRWRIVLATPLAFATARRWRRKSWNACFSPDEPPARRAASSKTEVESRLVEASAILLGNGPQKDSPCPWAGRGRDNACVCVI